MLVGRCPNLEELSINGLSSHPSDARRLMQGRWPKLRKLTLGGVALEDLQASTGEFFRAHQELQSLHTSRHALSPSHLSSSLSVDRESNSNSLILPHLTEFSGTLEQLQALLALGHVTLTTVGFDEPMPMHDVNISPLALSVALRGLYVSHDAQHFIRAPFSNVREWTSVEVARLELSATLCISNLDARKNHRCHW